MSTKHQNLVDEAYTIFSEDMSYEEFIDGLDEIHRDAMLLANLNFECADGGFGQWVSNAYDPRSLISDSVWLWLVAAYG